MESEENINVFFKKMGIFEKRWNMIREIMSHPLLACTDSNEIKEHTGQLQSLVQTITIYTNFLKMQSNQHIDYLEKARKGFSFTREFNDTLNFMTQNMHEMMQHSRLF